MAIIAHVALISLLLMLPLDALAMAASLEQEAYRESGHLLLNRQDSLAA